MNPKNLYILLSLQVLLAMDLFLGHGLFWFSPRFFYSLIEKRINDKLNM